MKQHLLLPSALLLLSLPMVAGAQEVGRVISSTALISQVSVPRQVCAQEQVQVQTQTPGTKSGAGALMGGIAGAALGNAVGQGSGRAAATILGVFGGAILGDRIEGGSPSQVAATQQTVNRCTTQNFIENRTTGYQVVYEYAGKQYSVQLPQDPGPTIQLQVTPAVTVQPQANTPAPVAPIAQAAPEVYVPISEYSPNINQYTPTIQQVQPQVVYVNPPVYYQRPYYPYPAFGTSLVIRSGGHHRGHWQGGHWR